MADKSSTVDKINPVKAWESASEENRFSDKSTWTVEDTGRSRIQLSTPAPAARLSLGYPPRDFGYPGLSMQAQHYFFLDVGGRSRMQFGMPVTWVAQKQWYAYAGKNIALGGGASAIFAMRNRFIVSAGGGYGAAAISDNGEMLPDGTWNSTDMNEILDATFWGLRGFDARLEDVVRAHETRLGYVLPPKPPAAATTPGAMVKLLSLIGGQLPEPTERSMRIARLLDLKTSAASALLEKVTRLMDGVTKLISRPDTAPFAGVVFKKLALLKEMNGSLRELMTFPQIGVAANRLGSPTGENDWERMWSWLALFGDFANRLTRVKNALKELLASLAQFLGVNTPEPSVLGLVGRDGVSIVTHDDVFAWAPNGFRFVGAANSTDYPVDAATRLMRFLRKKERAAADALGSATGTITKPLGSLAGSLLFGASPPPKGSDASFRVLMENDVELRAGGDAVIAASGADGTLRLEASLATEVAAAGVVGVGSRHGVVEVMGREVSIGVPTRADAKAAAKARLTLAASEATVRALREAQQRNATAFVDTRRRMRALRARRGEALDKLLVARHAPGGLAAAIEAQLEAEEVELRAALLATSAARRASEASTLALEAAEQQLVAARAAASAGVTSSRTAAAMDWAPKQQDLADTIGVHARDDVTVYSGKTLSIEAGESLELKAESVLAPIDTAVIKVDKQIELHVGAFKVTVAKDKVVVNNGAGDVLVIDANGATMKTPAGAKVSAQSAEVSLEATGNANIKANGRILLG